MQFDVELFVSITNGGNGRFAGKRAHRLPFAPFPGLQIDLVGAGGFNDIEFQCGHVSWDGKKFFVSADRESSLYGNYNDDAEYQNVVQALKAWDFK